MSCQSRKLHPGNCVSQTNQETSETVLVFCVPIWPEMYRWRKRATQFIKSVRKVVQILILLTLYPKGQSLVSCSVWLCRQGPGSHQQRYWVPWPAIKQKCIAAFWKTFFEKGNNQRPIHLRVSFFFNQLARTKSHTKSPILGECRLPKSAPTIAATVPSLLHVGTYRLAVLLQSAAVLVFGTPGGFITQCSYAVLSSFFFSLFFLFLFRIFITSPAGVHIRAQRWCSLCLQFFACMTALQPLCSLFQLCAGWRVRNNIDLFLYNLVSCTDLHP